MRLFRSRISLLASATGLVLCVAAVHVRADLAPWMQSVISGSAIEAALYRAMDLPGVHALFPRPPAEARRELDKLVSAGPASAELYALRAHTEEQSLDFASAERDWKSFVDHSEDKATAGFLLADFYRRRNQGRQEIAALEAAAALPSPATEKFKAADGQAAWRAYPQALEVARDQALDANAVIDVYKAWIARYPTESYPRGQFIAELLKMRRFADAQHAVDDYRAAFPRDPILPIKAAALLAFDQNSPTATAEALALFEKSYQPLWPDDLIATYFELLDATHTRHAMLLSTRAQLLGNPDDLAAATRLFRYYQQQGRSDAALEVFAEYGSSKDARHAAWSADELYTFAQLLERTGQYADAARYYYALAANPGRLDAISGPAAEAGLSGLTRMLLAAPNQSVALGAGNLSIYRDLATLDHGPGYLNGILSLWLNSADAASEFHEEEVKATPYFHRQKAADLLAEIDRRFPASAERASLHAQLIRAYVEYGQDAAVKQAGRQFLTDFPQSPQRMEIALEVADADARTNDTQAEFALYDSLLTELSAPLQGMPLSVAASSAPPAEAGPIPPGLNRDTDANDSGETHSAQPAPAPSVGELLQKGLDLPVAAPPAAAAAQEYSQVLERYIGRLLATNQPLAALAVLRRELDRNPNDPAFYERLSDFLEQNNLAAQEEDVYQRALARFNDTTFYDKLARFYIRQQRRQDFSALTRKVVDTFRGTELEGYFANVQSSWPEEYLQLNLYAHRRFPHDLAFVSNLLSAYQSRSTADPIAYQQLLREHWQDSPELQARFFDFLSGRGQLDAELAALEKLIPTAAEQQQNSAATRELAEIDLWQSHFEQSAPLLGALASAYPADTGIGQNAASVFRSLAYFDPSQIARSVEVQQHLFDADPTNADRLASIGDTYADSTANSLNLDGARQLASAAPFWRRMATVRPGMEDSYLASATVFWDYFQYDDAFAQIAEARKRFNNPSLFGYQAGAIYEGKRDYARAVAEYIAAVSTPQGTHDADSADAQSRLIVLAQRPQLASLIDKATAEAAAQHPNLATLGLRAEILNALHRQGGLGGLVASAISRAATGQDLADLAAFARERGLTAAYRAALEREIALTTDPVQHIELEYELARALQDSGDTASAQRIIEAVYDANTNSRLAGVVRSTTDFYWNSKQPQRAIATLVSAARKANQALAHDFLFEAIAKSNQSGNYAGARTLLKPLLAADPFNPQYLNLEAESYSLAHDNAGLRDFYLATLAALRDAPLDAVNKRDKTALARQGLIPALTGLKDYAGAMDQHIALISAFPEDAAILQAAVSYARLHNREDQLVDFFQKTITDSPRDSRFAIDLGRIDVQFEDYAGALNAYSKAIAIRSDRPDLYIARADLEEHQQAFDSACADYDRLYLLSYKDPQWMEKAALARARQGRPELAVKALQTAWLEGHTAAAPNYFRVARQLEQWNMLPQADPFLAQGIKLAGDSLLVDSANRDGAILYARIQARERKAGDAMAFLAQALQAADTTSPSSPAIVAREVEVKGLAGVTDSQWRAHLAETRRQQAQAVYRSALAEIFNVAGEFYTPEEKTALATLLDEKHASATEQEVVDVWIPAAHAAGLKDREAQWRRNVLLHGGALAQGQFRAFISLEDDRMDYATLADTLDTYAQQVRPVARPGVLSAAVTAWRNAGNRERETADLRQLVLRQRQLQYEQRLFEIYLRGDVQVLLQLTSEENNAVADSAANYLMANGTQAQAYSAVANRARSRPAVWGRATSALAGLYFRDTSTQVDSAFQAALANDTIGQRLQVRPDESKQIVGAPWFYYGTRYGYFLTLAKNPSHDPEDYLPAELELSSSSPSSYAALAATYRDSRKADAAVAEYRHMLELAPDDPSPHVSIAEALWEDGRHDAAIVEWNAALGKLRSLIDVRVVPETFWNTFTSICNDAAKYRVGPQLKPGMNLVLDAYVRKNGNYRSTELLHSAFAAMAPRSEAEAADWVVLLIADMPRDDQESGFSPLLFQGWFPPSQFGSIYQREIALAQAELQTPLKTQGDREMRGLELNDLARTQSLYVRWLLTLNRVAEAQRVFDSIDSRQRSADGLQVLAALLAARQSRVPSLLESYRADPSIAPSLGVLADAANQLQIAGDRANQRLVLEYIFDQKLRRQQLTAPDYLALAAARIATGDLLGAVDLLNRLTLQGDLYQNLDSAADLLVRTGYNAEALPMLKKLANGVPWQADYRLRLAHAQLALKQSADAGAALTSVASSDQAPYPLRASAASALRAIPSNRQLGSTELNLLSGAVAAQQSTPSYFVYARIAASNGLPVAQRSPMLHDALLNAPTPLQDFIRLRIFQAETAQDHYERAVVAIGPVVAKNGWLLFGAQPGANSAGDDATSGNESTTTIDDNTMADSDNTGADSETTQASTSDSAAAYSLHSVLASKGSQRTFLLALAGAEEHMRDVQPAINDLQAAQRLAASAAEKAGIAAHISALQHQLAVVQDNAGRRPVIQSSIEQTVRVRPRATLATTEVQP